MASRAQRPWKGIGDGLRLADDTERDSEGAQARVPDDRCTVPGCKISPRKTHMHDFGRPTRECEGCGQQKPIDDMSTVFLPGTGEAFQCIECRGGP